MDELSTLAENFEKRIRDNQPGRLLEKEILTIRWKHPNADKLKRIKAILEEA
jgi:hypothetical protein